MIGGEWVYGVYGYIGDGGWACGIWGMGRCRWIGMAILIYVNMGRCGYGYMVICGYVYIWIWWEMWWIFVDGGDSVYLGNAGYGDWYIGDMWICVDADRGTSDMWICDMYIWGCGTCGIWWILGDMWDMGGVIWGMW